MYSYQIFSLHLFIKKNVENNIRETKDISIDNFKVLHFVFILNLPNKFKTIINKLYNNLLKFTIEPLIFNDKSYINDLVGLIKQLWEYNFSNISKVIAPLRNLFGKSKFTYMNHSKE